MDFFFFKASFEEREGKEREHVYCSWKSIWLLFHHPERQKSSIKYWKCHLVCSPVLSLILGVGPVRHNYVYLELQGLDVRFLEWPMVYQETFMYHPSSNFFELLDNFSPMFVSCTWETMPVFSRTLRNGNKAAWDDYVDVCLLACGSIDIWIF